MRRMNREQRAELHFNGRAQWIVVQLRTSGRQAFGIPSSGHPGKYHLCDGDGCTCPDYRFRGLSGLRIGHAGAHVPCSHILAVQRVLKAGQAAVAEPQRQLRLVRGTE